MPDVVLEEEHFRCFLELLYPEQDLASYSKQESPDFLFSYSGRRIGVEHTQIFKSKDNSDRAEESLEDDLARRLAERFPINGINIQASIDFNIEPHMQLEEREHLVDEIHRAIRERVVLEGVKEVELFEFSIADERIVRVVCFATKRAVPNTVNPIREGWVKSSAIIEIEQAIDKKLSKIERYRDQCDEIWLLVVADGRVPSSYFAHQGECIAINSNLGFDKVYFLNAFQRSITEVISR